MMHYDRTKVAVLAWCDCGWRELALTPEGAHQGAADHERNVHPARTQARDALRQSRYRVDDDGGDTD
jgi:hypothetical protein